MKTTLGIERFCFDKKKVITSRVLSSADDYIIPLRWAAIMSNRIKADVAASTGVHDSESVIKMILAGANAVQMVSALYKNGTDNIEKVLAELKHWMNKNGYNKLEDFRGQLSQAENANPELFERVQFMKYFGGYVHNQ